MTVLETRDVSKFYPLGKSSIHVLDKVSIEVDKDEFVCIVGPSGCGKSTLLRIIAGLERPDSGTVLFHGQPHTGEFLL